MGYEIEAEKLKDRLLQSRTAEDGLLPKVIAQEFAIERGKVSGRPMYRLLPERPKGNIFYLYSSDMTLPIKKGEWQFIQNLCRMTQMAVTVPMYPIAPEQDCEDTFDMILPAYQQFCRRREAGPIIIFGVGAGAGLALSLQMLSWREGMPDPDKLVLLSPQLDTEFFDPEILKPGMLSETGIEKFNKKSNKNTDKKVKKWKNYLGTRRIFLDNFWVKNYAGRTEYTSPIYAEMTDICRDIFVVSGTDDPYNPYARFFVEKILDTGVEAKYFEYTHMPKDFFFKPGLKETMHMMMVMSDVLLDTDEKILHKYMEEVRLRADWSKWFPEIYKDEQAMKYVSAHPKTAGRISRGMNILSLLGAATQRAQDDAVRLFLKQYPNGTVVYVGCGLDTMLDRVDNGRVLWYDLDSPGRLSVRGMYARRMEREKRIDRSINDLSWMSLLSVDMDKGLLFVVKSTFAYMTRTEMREFLDRLYREFQGCNVIFYMATPQATRAQNLAMKRSGAEYRRKKLAMRDPRRDIELMNPIFSVVSVKSVLDGVEIQKDWKTMLKLQFISNKNRESRKLVHLRLGYERYRTS